MKIKLYSKNQTEAGYSGLFITLVLVGASLLLLSSTFTRTVSNARLNDRANLFVAAEGAAEAAVEKVLTQIMVDYAKNGQTLVSANLNSYRTQLLPTAAENPYWTNFMWSDGQGNNNQIYVSSLTTNVNPPMVALQQQYQGLYGNANTYRILANVTATNSNYAFTNAVAQDVQLAQIPVFQFAIFYNGLLEFSDCATMTINGRVNANSNIYTGCISGASLTFNYTVTCSGNITSPANDGFTTSQWQGPVTYNGTPSPGYLTGQPILNLPIGTLSNTPANMHKLIEFPDPTDATNQQVAVQRYYNKAYMILLVSNSSVTVTLTKSMTNTPGLVTNLPVGWTNIAAWNWFTTNGSFYDSRENKTVRATQIDIAKFYTWSTNYSNCTAMFGPNNPLNIIFVADMRDGSSTYLPAVRLINGSVLPPYGFTLATPNPLYILGYYNCPSSGGYQNNAYTVGLPPASVICDALTLLSPAWSDLLNQNSSSPINVALPDTVNTAIIAGIVYSTGTGTGQFSGGVHNLPRLLENWAGLKLTLNTSIVNLFPSYYATNQFVQPGGAAAYYAAPTRSFNFDQNYASGTNMPPGTPLIYRVIKAAWCNPPPGVVNWSNNWDYVAR